MKFNEKLIELRKKEGLSQEELGYKLNVTRQTVSKWELGQTTPEMDKLSEMSKIFNVSVDQLINDSETASDLNMNHINSKIEDQPIQAKEGKNSKTKTILIVVGIIAAAVILWNILQIILGLIIANKAIDQVKDLGGNIFNSALNSTTTLYQNVVDKMEEDSNTVDTGNIMNNLTEGLNQITGIIGGNTDSGLNETFNDEKDKITTKQFNMKIDLYAGTSNPLFAVTMLDHIITSNKTNDRKIEVEYNGTKTQEEAKIKNIKQTINKLKVTQSLEVTCEYDKDGYIYKVIIEKV